MNRWVLAILLVLAAALITALVSIARVNNFLEQPANIDEAGLEIVIEPGSSFGRVSADLARLRVIEHPDWFRWYARLTGKAASVRAGQYRLASGDSPADILQKFVVGEVELHSFTIVEGWTYRELIAAMAQSEIIRSSIVYEDWPSILQQFGATEGHPEGLFLPETYRFPKFTTDLEVLGQANDLMRDALAEEWQYRDATVPLDDPYDALILASIIEKETARVDERTRISGVFIRRLYKGMRLQTDPTVIYGIGESFDGNITRRHLKTDTPYNTYTRKGLPPTPIALPGRASIHAALNPAPGDELYFVATGIGDGSHKFSTTKLEHDAAVREYLARQRANRRN